MGPSEDLLNAQQPQLPLQQKQPVESINFKFVRYHLKPSAGLRHIIIKKDIPMLASVLDSSPRKSPPPIHRPGGETLQRHTSSCPCEKWHEKKKIHQSPPGYPSISKHWIITFASPPPTENEAHSVVWLWAPSGFHLHLAERDTLLPRTDKLLHALVPMKDESKEQPILHMIGKAS